jgi:hypothetical protein
LVSWYIARMTKDEFNDALEKLGYSRVRLAELFDIRSLATVQNWATGASPVPGPVVALVEYLLARPEAKAWFEVRRPPNKESRVRKVRREADARWRGKQDALGDDEAEDAQPDKSAS